MRRAGLIFLVGAAAVVLPAIGYELFGNIWLVNHASKALMIVFAPAYLLLGLVIQLPYPLPYFVGAAANGAFFVVLAKLASLIPEQHRVIRLLVFAAPFATMLTLLVLSEYGAT